MINDHKKIIIFSKKKIYKYNINILIFKIYNIILLPGFICPINIDNKKIKKIILKKIYKKKKYRIIGIINKHYDNYDIKIGTITRIIKIFKMPNKSITLILQGLQRFKIIKFIKKIYKNFLISNIEPLLDIEIKNDDPKYNYYLNILKKFSIKLIKLDINKLKFLIFTIKNINNILFLIYFIIINFNIPFKYKILILEEDSIINRCKILLKFLNFEIYKIKLKLNTQKKVKFEINNQQKEFYINQLIKTLQDKLGYDKYGNGKNYYNNDIKKFIYLSKKKKWPKKAKIKFYDELSKFKSTNPQMPEYNLLKNYLDFMLNLPWYKFTKDRFNFKKAIYILNKNHYGLKKIKNRILEFISVLKLNKNKKSPILCLSGSPGVGKTSLGKSISKVLSRKYVRISLGGIHDESEIRGHRKTYVGALPGRILQSIKKAGTSNPIFLLDEIDKMGIQYNNSTYSAMLEVLDPEQNKSFYDNYLELGYDLSKVLFIATANNINNIPSALLDRMELINISGYTIEEKIKISNYFLLPKLIKKNGLKNKKIIINKKNLEKIISNYTYESGIRNLERQIDKIIRYIVKQYVMHNKIINIINSKLIYKILGPSYNLNKYEKINIYGVSIGLAWTGQGGDILFIESTLLKKGKGNISFTGNIGKIMKESIIIAVKYIRSNYKKFNIKLKYFYDYDLHLHVPEGAIPKDGPSAGIAIFSSLISSYTKRRIKQNLAMTGEITLRGRVLPVGGIKEKILAAKRSKINKIILPKKNKKNIKVINKKYLNNIKFYFINEINEIINIAFKNIYV